jgi:hypothetical protein
LGRWQKLGRIFEPAGLHPKLATHAANPLAVPLGGDLFRIYYSGRDTQNRSSVGWVEYDLGKRRLTEVRPDPVIEHGPPGSFFADGISVGNCYEAGGVTYMLFMGWQAPADGHWRGDIGRLVVAPDGNLALDGNSPLMGADAEDPISLSYPWVMRDGAGYRMWYGSTTSWDAGNGEMLHPIKEATSPDGHAWTRTGLAVPYQLGIAQAFSRPTVLRLGDQYRMWFSYRGAPRPSYRIGSAASRDGEHWELTRDDADIDVSPEGWDSRMIEYPFCFTHRGEAWLLYNGDGYGRTGFGLAVWR